VFRLLIIAFLTSFLSGALSAQEVDSSIESDLAAYSQDINKPLDSRVDATRALQGFDGPNALIAVSRASRDSEKEMRLAAIEAARDWSVIAKWDLISPLIQDSDETVRRGAIHTLAIEWHDLPESLKPLLKESIEQYSASLSNQLDEQLEVAWLEQTTGQFNEALSRLSSIEKEQADWRITVGLANLHSLQGDSAAAISTLEKGVDTLPDQPTLHYQLAMQYYQLGDAQKSLPHFAKAHEFAPTNSQYSYVYALALREQNPAKSLRLLDMTYRQSGNPKHLYAKCDLQLSLNQDATTCIGELSKVAPRYAINQLTSQYGVTLP
jgi:tetratricopeptide (TPR) repeat protein